MDLKKKRSHSSPLPGMATRHAVARPMVLVVAASVVAVALTAAVLFGTRWTPSGGVDYTWVSAGVRVVLNAGSYMHVSDSGQDAVRPLATVPDPSDRLLGGLLSPDSDERSCLSRYRAASYRRASMHALSSHLVSALRRYESLHRRCGPGTPAYARAVDRLRSPATNATAAPSPAECSYLVWSPNAGLGNQILSITSAFLYALLTGRVLLLNNRDLDDVFCEPFPGSTWLLPPEDYAKRLPAGGGSDGVPERLGFLLSRGEAPGGRGWLFVHLRHDYKADDRRFFCDDVQGELLLGSRVPWLEVMADNYFAPGLFLVPRLEPELARMFPRRDAVFHHLGRYLFHPSNTVWGMVTGYHGASHFAEADERVGVQVRVFKWAPMSTDELYGQILSCVHRENILPGPGSAKANATATGAPPAKRKAVVFASLYSDYSDKLRDLYGQHGAAGGEAVSVFQPTHLGAQHFGDRQQNQKAFAEMVLLSFSDITVTTAASTFGYVSQGLAGRRPWVLTRPVRGKAPDTACRLAPTMEPCFHSPPNYDCRTKGRGDTGKTVRYIRHCEDFPQGVQLVE
ncbi:hypothetical protein EJB05_37785, partial [Eragrostis curvula]